VIRAETASEWSLNLIPSLAERFQTPALVVFLDVARSNIRRVIDDLGGDPGRWRPHLKTTKMPLVWAELLEAGVRRFKCATTREAAVLLDLIRDRQIETVDLLVAYPLPAPGRRRLAALAEANPAVRLAVLVEDPPAAATLPEPLAAFVDLNPGMNRTGIPAERTSAVIALARQIQAVERVRLAGLLTHAGHAYAARGREAIEAVHRGTVETLHGLRDALTAAGVRDVALSLGDTPTCSVVEDFGGVDEMRPGNFAFYDLMQLEIGACAEADLALALACPVVAVYPERGELALYGGAVHLSKEFLSGEDGRRVYGRVALPEEGGWGPMIQDAHVSSLSQEHGIVKSEALVGQVRVGDLLLVLPIHACLAADLMRAYRTLDGETLAVGNF